MNETQYRNALDRIAERGTRRGADAVFSAAESTPSPLRSPSKPERLTRHWILAVAAVVLLVAVGVGVLKRPVNDDQQILLGPGSDVHRYRVGDTGGVRVNKSDGKADPPAQQQEFMATITARLKAYGINDPSVMSDSTTSVIVSLPTSIPTRVATVLLGTQGRLAMDRLGKPVDLSSCAPGMSQAPGPSNLAGTREGHWPTWGTVTNCYTVAESNPISLWLQGRDPTARIPVPGASVEQLPGGATVDVVVHFDSAINRFMGTIPPATPCTQPCAAQPVDGISVTFDGTTLTTPDNLGHSSATFSLLSADDANILQAILLGGSYLSRVTIADLGTSPLPTAPLVSSVPNPQGTATSTRSTPGTADLTIAANAGCNEHALAVARSYGTVNAVIWSGPLTVDELVAWFNRRTPASGSIPRPIFDPAALKSSLGLADGGVVDVCIYQGRFDNYKPPGPTTRPTATEIALEVLPDGTVRFDYGRDPTAGPVNPPQR